MPVNSAAVGRVIAHGATTAQARAESQRASTKAARTGMLRGAAPGGAPAAGGAPAVGSGAAPGAASSGAPGGQAGGESSEAQGALAKVGAAFGALTSAEQSLSSLLSGIPMPAFPAARINDWAFAPPHAHSHPPNLIPPAPPVPLPATGPILKIPFVSGADKVLINNMPAARCGDIGVQIWCGGFFPFYEIFLGSSSVWIEGARAARLGVDITKHCIFSTPKPNDPPLGPMIGAIIQGSPNVIIGGVPLPSLTSFAVGAAFKVAGKGIGKVVKKVKAAKAAAAAKKAAAEPLAGSIRNVNPVKRLGKTGRTQNCVNCAIATDAMLAGHPATALPSPCPVPIRVLEERFGSKFGPTTTIAKIESDMAAAGSRARGIVFGNRGAGQTGHVFNVVNQNGVVRFLDGQTGKVANTQGFKGFQLLRTN